MSDALVAAGLEHAQQAGARAVTLWVYEQNPAAARAFERAGFRLTGRRGREGTDGLGRGRDYVEYRRDITEHPA